MSPLRIIAVTIATTAGLAGYGVKRFLSAVIADMPAPDDPMTDFYAHLDRIFDEQ